MKFFKPKFWDNTRNILSFLLWPISLITQILIILKKKFSTQKKFNIPVVCVGNIYIGGTGKTPLSLVIANELRKQSRKPVIIRKLYHSHLDEHKMIKNHNIDLILDKNRVSAIEKAVEEKFNVAVLDDGFQDVTISKDVSIVCFNSKQKIGNGFVIPAGPLRESMNSLQNAKFAIINGEKSQVFEDKINKISKNIDIFYSKYTPINIKELENKKLLAFAGIGNPENFFDLLRDYDLNLKKTIKYPDHYNYSKEDLQRLVELANEENSELVTTEKDYFRIKKFEFNEIKYLKVNLEILDKENLINKVLSYL